ncbi:unnamed protein product, partial [Trichogramma brassicae]
QSGGSENRGVVRTCDSHGAPSPYVPSDDTAAQARPVYVPRPNRDETSRRAAFCVAPATRVVHPCGPGPRGARRVLQVQCCRNPRVSPLVPVGVPSVRRASVHDREIFRCLPPLLASRDPGRRRASARLARCSSTKPAQDVEEENRHGRCARGSHRHKLAPELSPRRDSVPRPRDATERTASLAGQTRFSRSPRRSDAEMSDGAPTVVQVPPSQPRVRPTIYCARSLIHEIRTLSLNPSRSVAREINMRLDQELVHRDVVQRVPPIITLLASKQRKRANLTRRVPPSSSRKRASDRRQRDPNTAWRRKPCRGSTRRVVRRKFRKEQSVMLAAMLEVTSTRHDKAPKRTRK